MKYYTKDSTTTNTMVDNYRPLQALSGRTVQRSFAKVTGAGGSSNAAPASSFRLGAIASISAAALMAIGALMPLFLVAPAV